MPGMIVLTSMPAWSKLSVSFLIASGVLAFGEAKLAFGRLVVLRFDIGEYLSWALKRHRDAPSARHCAEGGEANRGEQR